ncbi:MMPL family protein [Lignipirellula cremea]|uniref:MMPL family protein n=1 Tax=Lignipirellula cremea TaxID=2528010 RepID=A0A518DL41_9BACT|nr:MMPL family protein [Lignipirellula cremea]
MLLALCLAPVFWYCAERALETNLNDPMEWLPSHFDETRRLMEFGALFGSDSFFVISWPGATLDDPRIPALAKELEQVRFDGKPLFGMLTSGGEIVDTLQQPPLELSREQAIERLEGILIGRETGVTGVIGTLQQFTPAAQHFGYDAVQQAIAQTPGLDPASVKLAGTAFDGVFIDLASQHGLYAIMITCYVISFVLLLVSFRNLSIAGAVMAVSILNQYMTMALVWLAGSHMDSILLVAPSLVYVLSISTGVHLVNYYRDALHHYPAAEAPTWAVRQGLTPCTVAAATTALGLISLTASYLAPIERFGVFASVGVLISTGLSLLFLPAFLAGIAPGKWCVADDETVSDAAAEKRLQQRLRKWNALAKGIALATPLVLLLLLAVGAAGLGGLYRLQASARIHDMFSPQAKVIQDYAWLEQAIGPLVPVEVVLQFPRQSAPPEELLRRLRLVRSAQAAVGSLEHVDATLSALNFSPDLPPEPTGRLSMRDLVRQRVLQKKLVASEVDFVDLRMLHAGDDWESWRISGRVSSGKTIDMKQVLRQVREAMQPVAADMAVAWPDAQVLYSGSMPILQRTQEQLLEDLMVSFMIAFVFIAIAIAVMLMVHAAPEFQAAPGLLSQLLIAVRCLFAALAAMIPNVLPFAVVFGAMGWLGVKIEIGTVMTATVAMGVAVDDTLHFVTWFRRSVLAGSSRLSAIAFGYRHCGAAMIQTSVICGVGLLGFTLSEFGPMQRFAWLMFSMLLTALLADLVVLPALLYSPLGRLFTPPGVPRRD